MKAIFKTVTNSKWKVVDSTTVSVDVYEVNEYWYG